jgi:hypothetical protein
MKKGDILVPKKRSEFVDGVRQKLSRIFDDEHLPESLSVSADFLRVETGRDVSSWSLVFASGQNSEEDQALKSEKQSVDNMLF